MNRAIVGWIALALACGGLVLRAYFPNDTSIGDSCWRPGLLMALLWLALPQLRELPRWMTTTVLIVGVVVMWKPKLLIWALPVLAVLWVLRPRQARR